MKRKLIICMLVTMTLFFSACSGQNTDAAEISEEKAREIALSHAGVNADQATFIKSHIDLDNGKKVYDVEFYTADGKEYDYEIDTASGNILDYDFDVENFID